MIAKERRKVKVNKSKHIRRKDVSLKRISLARSLNRFFKTKSDDIYDTFQPWR
jgi:hypothetical protein